MSDLNLVAAILGAIIALVVLIAAAFLVQLFLKRIPREHRLMHPAMAWLLIIPGFHLIWSFVLFPRVARSFKRYFDDIDFEGEQDCGYSLAIWFAVILDIWTLICWQWCLGPAIGLPVLILFVMLMLRFNGMKNRIVVGDAAELAQGASAEGKEPSPDEDVRPKE
jgi:hypothetical protein